MSIFYQIKRLYRILPRSARKFLMLNTEEVLLSCGNDRWKIASWTYVCDITSSSTSCVELTCIALQNVLCIYNIYYIWCQHETISPRELLKYQLISKRFHKFKIKRNGRPRDEKLGKFVSVKLSIINQERSKKAFVYDF